MEIPEITFYLSLAAFAGVLQEQLILLLLLRIRRRERFLLEVPFAICAKVFGTESLPKKYAFSEYDRLELDPRKDKLYLISHNYFYLSKENCFQHLK